MRLLLVMPPLRYLACLLVLLWAHPTSGQDGRLPVLRNSKPGHPRSLLREVLQYDNQEPSPTNFRPVIGVLSQPKDSATYIAASYVKYLEMAGARVVPIFSDSTEDEHRHMFAKLNALLVPGGDQDLKPGNSYYDSQSLFTDLAMEAFEKGDIFPIHFTCLGFEALSIKFSGNYSLLGEFPAMETVDPLKWTPEADTARMLRLVPPELKQAAGERGLAYMSHSYGIALSDFYNTPLKDSFNLLSTSIDQEGKEYLSTMEHKSAPIFGVQWHPEKAPFEWSEEILDPDHSLEAIQLSQAFANQFVEWARMSNHSFSSPEDVKELNRRLIYNYRPIFDPAAYFTETYVFTHGGNDGFSLLEAIVFACIIALTAATVAVLAARQIANKMKLARSESSESGSFEARNEVKDTPRRAFARMSSELQPLAGSTLSSTSGYEAQAV